MNFFFHELHIFNLPLAFLFKIFGNVFVYKYKGFCRRFLLSNFFPSINDFKDIDQWNTQKEITLKLLQTNFHEIRNSTITINILGKKLDLENLYLQNFAIEFEQYNFFITLIKNHEGKKFVLDKSFRSFLKKHHPNFLADENNIHFLPSLFFDLLYIKFLYILDFLKAIYRLFFNMSKKHAIGQYKYLCTGISPSEYPSNNSDLNFAWLVANKIVNAKDILYILNSTPSDQEACYLKTENINYLSISDLYSNLPTETKVQITFDLSLNFLLTFFSFNHYKMFKYKAFIATRIWHDFLKIISPRFLICSFSSGWPENPEVSLCKSFNIKYILWLYSSGEFIYSNSKNPFTDSGIRFSVNEASEIWVWNDLVKELFEERLLPKLPSITIKVMGPILNGNWNILKDDTTDVYHESDEIKTVAVFDLTPMKSRMRLNFGEGPFCNSELQEKFYQGILRAYFHFPHLKFIIKTKRFHNEELYDLVPSLKKLINLNSDRIYFPSAKNNPYEVIAKADLTISIPYTSPTMLALTLGKKAFYFDPLKLCSNTFKNAFDEITINNELILIEQISNYTLPTNRNYFHVTNLLEIREKIIASLN